MRVKLYRRLAYSLELTYFLSMIWMLVCWWWWFDWSFARLISPVVATISIILSSGKFKNGDILVQSHVGSPKNGHKRVWVMLLNVVDNCFVLCCFQRAVCLSMYRSRPTDWCVPATGTIAASPPQVSSLDNFFSHWNINCTTLTQSGSYRYYRQRGLKNL